MTVYGAWRPATPDPDPDPGLETVPDDLGIANEYSDVIKAFELGRKCGGADEAWLSGYRNGLDDGAKPRPPSPWRHMGPRQLGRPRKRVTHPAGRPAIAR
jgi:hypothetical protein